MGLLHYVRKRYWFCKAFYKHIVNSDILFKVDDIVIDTIKRPDNRTALFVYEGDKRLEFKPDDIIKFTMADK